MHERDANVGVHYTEPLWAAAAAGRRRAPLERFCTRGVTLMTSMMMTAMVMTDSAGTRVVNGGQIITAGGRRYFKTPKKLEKGTGSQ
jgi:hypothetical protein